MRKNNIYDVLRVNNKIHLKGVKMYVIIKLLKEMCKVFSIMF